MLTFTGLFSDMGTAPENPVSSPPLVELTVKLTAKLSPDGMLLPVTVTVALYDPAARLMFGVTEKISLPLPAMLVIDVLSSVKLEALAPDRDIVSAPLGWLPVLLIVTL